MTLELARKRRDQSDLIHELVDALEALLRAYVGEYEDDFQIEIEDSTMHEVLFGARAVLEKAKEHDCIPWDDAKEVAQQ